MFRTFVVLALPLAVLLPHSVTARQPRLAPAATSKATAATLAPRVRAWRAFFARVLPAAADNFASLRGALRRDDAYATKVPFDSRLVRDCQIFGSGYGEGDLRCVAVGYDSKDGIDVDALSADLTAALPGFTRDKNLMGEPRWRDDRHHTSVTIVFFGGVLVNHGGDMSQ